MYWILWDAMGEISFQAIPGHTGNTQAVKSSVPCHGIMDAMSSQGRMLPALRVMRGKSSKQRSASASLAMTTPVSPSYAAFWGMFHGEVGDKSCRPLIGTCWCQTLLGHRSGGFLDVRQKSVTMMTFESSKLNDK